MARWIQWKRFCLRHAVVFCLSPSTMIRRQSRDTLYPMKERYSSSKLNICDMHIYFTSESQGWFSSIYKNVDTMKNSNELPIFCLPINLRGWWYFDPEGVSDIVSLTQPINSEVPLQVDSYKQHPVDL